MLKTTNEVRDHIFDSLKREIVGPDPGLPAMQINREEILRPQDPPRLRYGAGVLFPMKADIASQDNASEEEVQTAESGLIDGQPSSEEPIGPDDMGIDSIADQRPETEQDVNLTNEYLPSAMGVSTLVQMPRHLTIKISAARYEQLELQGAGRINKEGKYIPYYSWWRIPIESEIFVDCQDLNGESIRTLEVPVTISGAETDLHVHILSRPLMGGITQSLRIITVTLINRKIAQGNRPRDHECYFQCGFEVYDPEHTRCFLEYPERPINPEDEEDASLRLLYHHRKVFAVGHGCAPNWSEPEDGASEKIWTEVLPRFEVNPVLPVEIKGLDLSMHILSDWQNDDSLRLCNRLANEYEAWILREESKIGDPTTVPPDLEATARRHIDRCHECLERMRYGIHLLQNNSAVRRAFALMNRAMLMQQIHYKISSEPELHRKWIEKDNHLVLERPYEPPDYNDLSRKWRPFQLAFILMNLRSMAEPDSDEREIVDLVWFPTGGGKTEAYLGLAAFTIFLRRILEPTNGGTTVLMRYTLRLLTTQQYQRAASLICACEYLRRSAKSDLGSTPITIGLWVGGEVTPNTEQEALASLRRLLEGERENKFVILKCPWCGTQMGPVKIGRRTECKGYRQLSRPARVIFRCEDPDCAFSDGAGLPLKVVDEAIYLKPPTLVIGTVDKFALLPWKPEAKSLFGLVPQEKLFPPDLIIQDEMHLISGPLGSMVGHYETVINALCVRKHREKQIIAKIVASTATISRAGEQIQALYGRKHFLFPPQSLRAGDSFFAEERPDIPGRMYIGVFASALPSHVTAQIRVISALLQSPKLALALNPALLDPYWTLMAYFNSLRELGHAATLIRADIREYLNAVWDRMGLTFELGGVEATSKRRFINHDLELTSRVQSNQIPEILQQLFNRYDGSKDSEVVDICLATNMIQVGLDIPRLSLMTVAGQPKTTSEYIQATSRVGRSKPGLVVTVYNVAKPRDRSHYEHFRAYHESVYRYVEPTSVTPFAVPVRERALHALIVSLVRFWGNQELTRRPSPMRDDLLLQRVEEVLLDRVQIIDPHELAETEAMIEEIIGDWKRIQPPRYGDFAPPTREIPLMYPSGSPKLPEWNDISRATLTSMRNVDADCDARVLSKFPQPEEV